MDAAAPLTPRRAWKTDFIARVLVWVLCLSSAGFAAAPAVISDANQVMAVTTQSDPAVSTNPPLLSEVTLQARKQAMLADASLDADTRNAASGFYDKAMAQRKSAQDIQTRIDALIKLRTTIPEDLARVRDRLAHPNDVSVAEVADVGLEQAEQAFAVAQQTLIEARQRAAQWEAEAKRRGERLGKIPSETSDIQSQLTGLQSQLQTPPPTDQPKALIAARRLWWRSQIETLTLQANLLQIERQVYTASDDLLVAQRQWATRQVVHADEQVTAWQRHLDRLRQEKVAAEQRAAERAAQAAQFKHPKIRELAEQNAALTQEEGTLVDKVKTTVSQVQELAARAETTREEWTHLRDNVEKAGEVTHVMGTYLIGKRSNLPLVGAHRRRIRDRGTEISRAQVAWMTADQQWSQLAAIESDPNAVLRQLLPDLSEDERGRLKQEALPLLQKRRQFLERIRKLYLDYSTALAELDVQERDFVANVDAYAEFLDAHILWARNLSPLRPKQLAVAWEALRWLGDVGRWRGLVASLGVDLRTRPSTYLLTVLFAALLLLMRWWACAGIGRVADRIHATPVGSLLDTAVVVVLTAMASWAWAGGVWLVRDRLAGLPDDRDFVDVVCGGMRAWIWLLLLVSTARAMYRPRGLADLHLRVHTETLLYVRRYLMLLFGLLAPVTFIWGALAQQADPRYVNSLGALAFIGGMLILMVFSAGLLRWQGPLLAATMKRREDSWLYRLRYIWYVALVGGFLGIALLTAMGYLYAARLFFEKMAVTLGLLLLALLLGGLFKRWLWVTRFRLARLQDQRRQELAREASEASEAGGVAAKESDRVDDGPRVTIFELSEQARRVLNMVVAVVLIVALWRIWNDLLPALERLEAIGLWRISDPQSEIEEWIRLGSLIQSLLIALVTIVTARNVPGLLEMLVLGRLPLDRGLRFAIATLSRYLLVVIGLVLAFNQIGIGWSKVQWLVAAMTVGLGFGLQEIFANFISGLIILVERPIRVEDIVTVGEVTGRVTSIKTRATTIRRLDERELIVPNKEFVTGQLINWTLTDNVLRKDFVVGIAYGSDIAKAERVLYEVARAHPLVLKEPPPLVLFQGFGGSSLDFELRVYLLGMDQYIQVWHEVNCAIDTAFRREGIEIAFPQRDLHVRSIDPKALESFTPEGIPQ